MSLIIDRQCVHKTINEEAKKKGTNIPKKYLKLTCPLALLANNNHEHQIPLITTDELSQHFDDFFPGKKNLTKEGSKSSYKIDYKIKDDSTKHTIKRRNGGNKNKTRKRHK
tara:strand:+ start:521 stop:853 length:333 start_codon:yes stop_codon:yes gene_type:complete